MGTSIQENSISIGNCSGVFVQSDGTKYRIRSNISIARLRKRSIYNSFAFRHPARSADVGFSWHTTLWWWAPISTQYFVVYAKMYPWRRVIWNRDPLVGQSTALIYSQYYIHLCSRFLDVVALKCIENTLGICIVIDANGDSTQSRWIEIGI